MRGKAFWNEVVENLLKQYGIKYFKEVSCKDLKGDKYLLRFDFMLINRVGYGILIEMDETQNHKNKPYDKIKDDYCIKRKYPLLRIRVNNNDKSSDYKVNLFKKTVDRIIEQFIDGGIVTLTNDPIFLRVIDVTKLDKPTGLGHFAVVNNRQYFYDLTGEYIDQQEIAAHKDIREAQQFLLTHRHTKILNIHTNPNYKVDMDVWGSN